MSDSGARKIAKERWNDEFMRRAKDEIVYDDWLDGWQKDIIECSRPIIDLGCGVGNNTKYLLEKGKEVIPCDYADKALFNIRKRFPEVKQTKCFDMTQGIPFADNFTSIVIADLSLHYFSEEITYSILNEIKRILQPEGLLFFRVNSIFDENHGSGQGKKVAEHFYQTPDGREKRFFDQKDIEKFWQTWQLLFYQEENMKRYALNKVLWRCVARKN